MLVRALILLLVSCLPFGAPLAAPQVEIHLAHSQRQTSASDPAAVTVAQFKRLVEQGSGGAIAVRIHPESRLGGNREMTKLVDANIIQSALITIGGIAPFHPPVSVTQIPFAIPDRASAYGVFDGPFGQRLSEDIKARTRFQVLGYADPGGFHVIANSQHPVARPADMTGLKIRAVPGFATQDAMIRALGSVPVKVASREEFNALSSGVVNAALNPVSVIVARGHDAVLRHVTLTNHLYSPYVWLFNSQTMAALSPEQRELIASAASTAISEGRKAAQAWESSENGLARVRGRLQVHDLSPAERQSFSDATQPAVKARLAKDLGPEGEALISDFLKAVKAAGRP